MTALKAVQRAAHPSAELVNVTPEMAERWLGKNQRNRNIRGRDITKYAREMSAGSWRITGEAIKFANDGALLDGQHRLHAVIRSNMTVPLFVVRGLQTDAQDVMDSGKARTAADMIKMHGYGNATTVAAIAKIAVGIEQGVDPDALNSVGITHSEIGAWIEDHPEIEGIAHTATSLYKNAECAPSMLGYTLWRLSHIDAIEAAQFWTDVSEKANLAANDPALTLAKKFAEIRRNRQRLPLSSQLSLTYRAWNARRANKKLTFIRVNSTSGGLAALVEPR